MIRRPPRSTLFPTRRSSDLSIDPGEPAVIFGRNVVVTDPTPDKVARLLRSEEHTSELQSHLNLVCRLLLEKKKMRCAEYADTVSRRLRTCVFSVTVFSCIRQ